MSLVFQNFDPPPPSPPWECASPPPPPKAGDTQCTHSPGGKRGGGSIFGFERHTVGLPSSLTVIISLRSKVKLCGGRCLWGRSWEGRPWGSWSLPPHSPTSPSASPWIGNPQNLKIIKKKSIFKLYEKWTAVLAWDWEAGQRMFNRRQKGNISVVFEFVSESFPELRDRDDIQLLYY